MNLEDISLSACTDVLSNALAGIAKRTTIYLYIHIYVHIHIIIIFLKGNW